MAFTMDDEQKLLSGYQDITFRNCDKLSRVLNDQDEAAGADRQLHGRRRCRVVKHIQEVMMDNIKSIIKGISEQRRKKNRQR
jgi:hypothetical protein